MKQAVGTTMKSMKVNEMRQDECIGMKLKH